MNDGCSCRQPCLMIYSSTKVRGKPSNHDVRVCRSAGSMVELNCGRILFAHCHGISTPCMWDESVLVVEVVITMKPTE